MWESWSNLESAHIGCCLWRQNLHWQALNMLFSMRGEKIGFNQKKKSFDKWSVPIILVCKFRIGIQAIIIVLLDLWLMVKGLHVTTVLLTVTCRINRKKRKHYVTKLMRLHDHLGFYVYVTLCFMVNARLLIGCGSLSPGRLSSVSQWHFSLSVTH